MVSDGVRGGRWLIAILTVLVLVLGSAVVLLGLGGFKGLLGVSKESSDTQVVQAIQTDDDVVLVTLGIQGIARESRARQILGKNVPGTGTTLYLQYGYSAKLGVDGSEVSIEKISEGRFRINVPPFKFIGHSDVKFETAVEDNGVLGFVSPDIDVPEMVTKLLDSDAIDQHLADNRELLKNQCEVFYGGIVHSIDPTVELEFVYTDGSIDS